MLVTGVVKIIIIGILKHPLVEKCPSKNILPFRKVSEYFHKWSLEHTIASCLFSMVFTAISAKK
jgi:hypothetical protein